jgi:hypothetical protein
MKKHEPAVWAALAAFFASVITIGTIDILEPGEAIQFAGAVIIGLFTGGGVYANQRLIDARTERRIEDKKENL